MPFISTILISIFDGFIVFDVNGIELLKDSRNNISFDQKIIINLSFLKDGLYFINTKQENNYISKKIQINKN